MTIPNTTAALIAFTMAAVLLAVMVWIWVKIYREDRKDLQAMRRKRS